MHTRSALSSSRNLVQSKGLGIHVRGAPPREAAIAVLLGEGPVITPTEWFGKWDPDSGEEYGGDGLGDPSHAPNILGAVSASTRPSPRLVEDQLEHRIR